MCILVLVSVPIEDVCELLVTIFMSEFTCIGNV